MSFSYLKIVVPHFPNQQTILNIVILTRTSRYYHQNAKPKEEDVYWEVIRLNTRATKQPAVPPHLDPEIISTILSVVPRKTVSSI
jgi:hypothetical protein